MKSDTQNEGAPPGPAPRILGLPVDLAAAGPGRPLAVSEEVTAERNSEK